MRMAVPWVLANATAEEEASLRATAPRLLGVIQDRVWEPRFAPRQGPAVPVDSDLRRHDLQPPGPQGFVGRWMGMWRQGQRARTSS